MRGICSTVEMQWVLLRVCILTRERIALRPHEQLRENRDGIM
jgi:hypothetical protein